MEATLTARQAALDALLRAQGRFLVAFSGGVDSAYLLWRAHHVAGERCSGVLADSPSLARAEHDEAVAFCRRHGLTLRVIATHEVENPDYQANSWNRCFFCKHELFDRMTAMARAEGYDALAYGENADDVGEDRPGRMAAAEFRVLAPLKEAGLTKADIRTLAREAGLEVADKVASPCLASRIPHGLEVTPEKLRQVETAETVLRDLGFRIVRVRHHGMRALVQVGPDETARLLAEPERTTAVGRLQAAGFSEVEFDPAGYRGAGLI
jgi:uncharacterized protein